MEHVAARSNVLTDQEEADQHAVIVTRMALLQARFGSAFGDDGLAIARGAIEASVKRAAQLRRVPLRNADEPAGGFVPVRASDSGDSA